MLAYSNGAMNPIIYAGFNDNFRKGNRGIFDMSSDLLNNEIVECSLIIVLESLPACLFLNKNNSQ